MWPSICACEDSQQKNESLKTGQGKENPRDCFGQVMCVIRLPLLCLAECRIEVTFMKGSFITYSESLDTRKLEPVTWLLQVKVQCK